MPRRGPNPERLPRDPIRKRLDGLLSEGVDLQGEDSDSGALRAWAERVHHALKDTLGANHHYVEAFAKNAFYETPSGQPRVNFDFVVNLLEGILKDAKSGNLANPQMLFSADVFHDFLDMAGHLIEAGYFRPAASLVGATLEDGLRRIAESRGVDYDPTKGLTHLNGLLVNAKVYPKLVHDKIQVWTTVRNKADHGQWDEFKEADVVEMRTGVADFLGNYLR